MKTLKWGRPGYSGVGSKCGKWYLQASRDIHDTTISWSVFYTDTMDGWLDSRVAEVNTLAEAKAKAQELQNEL